MANQTTPAIQVKDSNVGIGTASPLTALHVIGLTTIEESGNIAFYGGNFVRVFNDQNFNIRNVSGTTVANISVNGASYFNGGNVGIGTTAPSSILHVDGTDPYVRINNVNSANNQGIKISYNYSDTHGFHLSYNANVAGAYIDNTYPITSGQPWGDIYFRQNNGTGTMLTRMTIKADGGNVGIGTTSPNAKLNIRGTDGSGSVTPQEDVLHVGGNELGGVGGYAGIRIGGAGNTSYGAYIRGVKTTAYGNYWNTALTFSVTRTNTETTIDEVMRITSGANVLIGTTTDDGYKLRVNGTSYFDGLAHFGQTATRGSAFRWGSYGTAVSADTMLCMNQLWNGSGWTILNSGVGTTYLNLGGEVASPTIQFGTGPANKETQEQEQPRGINLPSGEVAPTLRQTILRISL